MDEEFSCDEPIVVTIGDLSRIEEFLELDRAIYPHATTAATRSRRRSRQHQPELQELTAVQRQLLPEHVAHNAADIRLSQLKSKSASPEAAPPRTSRLQPIARGLPATGLPR